MVLFETDIGVILRWTLYQDGGIANLTDVVSVKLFVHNLAGSPFTLTVMGDPLDGVVEYINAAGDFPQGSYAYNIEVTYANPARLYTTKTKQLTSKPLYGS